MPIRRCVTACAVAGQRNSDGVNHHRVTCNCQRQGPTLSKIETLVFECFGSACWVPDGRLYPHLSGFRLSCRLGRRSVGAWGGNRRGTSFRRVIRNEGAKRRVPQPQRHVRRLLRPQADRDGKVSRHSRVATMNRGPVAMGFGCSRFFEPARGGRAKVRWVGRKSSLHCVWVVDVWIVEVRL